MVTITKNYKNTVKGQKGWVEEVKKPESGHLWIKIGIPNTKTLGSLNTDYILIDFNAKEYAELRTAVGAEGEPKSFSVSDLLAGLTKEQTQELVKACALIADSLSQELIKKAASGSGEEKK